MAATKRTVLLVDDDPRVLAGLSRALRGEPYEVIGAGSGEEALEILEGKPVDVVISDEDMPGMRGTALLQRVRERYPDTVRFMLTGKGTLENAVQAINAGGISRFFMKPCNSIDLAVSIRQGLEHRDLLVAARRLLRKTQDQDTLLKELEKKYPYISRVEADDDGAIEIEESGCDYNELIEQICRQFE
jgi:two-component system probable response regulator PhcQ